MRTSAHLRRLEVRSGGHHRIVLATICDLLGYVALWPWLYA